MISLHRQDAGTFYPRRDDSGAESIGRGKGVGFHANVAWQTGLVVDESNRQNNTRSDLGAHEYKLAFERLVLPLATEFQPDVVVISCGFDAGIGDPIGWSRLSPMMYFWMTH